MEGGDGLGTLDAAGTADSGTTVDPTAEGTRAPDPRSQRLAFIAFVVILIAAFPLLLHLGHDRWFRYDDWDFLAGRSATSLHDLFEPHVVHWSTLPILLYRALWLGFGIHSYTPYLAASVLTHLGVAALVRTVMRRAGVRPWTATAVATLLVLLGSGDENILWAFGVTFAASLAFGLGQLILADHDGGLDYRDWLGLLSGFAGLLCSGIAVTMVIIVGISALTRRGWRAAAFHTVPLGVAYGIWFLAIGKDGYQDAGAKGEVFTFVTTAGGVAFGRIAHVPFLGWALGALIIGGCYLAWSGRSRAYLRRFAAAPAAMLVGALIFLVISGLGRGSEIAHATRYTHIVATLLLPAIAVAADAVMIRWRVTVPILAVALGFAIVGNVRLFDNAAQQTAGEFQRGYRQYLLTVPRLPITRQLPRDLHTELGLAPWITIGWLEDGVASGRIPRPAPESPSVKATDELKLALRQPLRHRVVKCVPVTAPADVRLERGGSIRATGPVSIVSTSASGAKSIPTLFTPPGYAPYLVAYAGPLHLRVQTVPEGKPFQVCDANGGPLTGLGG